MLPGSLGQWGRSFTQRTLAASNTPRTGAIRAVVEQAGVGLGFGAVDVNIATNQAAAFADSDSNEFTSGPAESLGALFKLAEVMVDGVVLRGSQKATAMPSLRPGPFEPALDRWFPGGDEKQVGQRPPPRKARSSTFQQWRVSPAEQLLLDLRLRAQQIEQAVFCLNRAFAPFRCSVQGDREFCSS